MKKFTCLLLCFLLACGTTGCGSKNNQKQNYIPVISERDEAVTEAQKAFDEFLTNIFKEEVGSDALSLHYVLKDPSSFDLSVDEITLGTISEEETHKSEKWVQDTLDQLNGFDLDELNASQQDDYKVVKAYLELNNVTGLDYYGNLFAPATSLTSNLITNFTEFDFRSENDLETYLILLADVARYLDEALVYTEKQVELGLYMQDYTVDEVVSEIDKFIAKTEDNELILSMQDKLDEMSNLNADKKEEVLSRNEEIVLNRVIPAYQKVRDSLLGWKGSATTSGGLASLPEGKKYYEAIMRFKIGYQGDIDALFEKGQNELKDIMASMVALMYKDSALYDRYVDSASYFETKEPEEILKNYQTMLLSDYPQGPEVSYTAEYLDPSIANASTIAYYLIPPIDDVTDNVIKINPTQTENNIETLYTTLAHEGFPGHCYQNTYYFSLNPHPIRTQYDFLGYGEGWAMAVELDALKWLLPDDSNLADFLGYDIYYPYLLQAMIDIGVNYYNWDQAQLKTWLAEYGVVYGLDNDESVAMLYQGVISDPSVLLAYGIGMMEMVTLKKKAQEALENKFNLVEYHQVILHAGPMTFDLLEQKVDAWIAAKQ